MKRSMKVFVWVAGILALPGLAGCGGGATPTAPAAPRPVSASVPNGLTATVTEDRATVPVGGTVIYTLTLTNPTAQPITFLPVRSTDSYPTGGVGDALVLTDAAGKPAFALGAFAAVVGYGQLTTLAPGKSVSGTLSVGGDKALGGFPAAGRYSARVTFRMLTGPNYPSLVAVPEVEATAGPLDVDAQ